VNPNFLMLAPIWLTCSSKVRPWISYVGDQRIRRPVLDPQAAGLGYCLLALRFGLFHRDFLGIRLGNGPFRTGFSSKQAQKWQKSGCFGADFHEESASFLAYYEKATT